MADNKQAPSSTEAKDTAKSSQKSAKTAKTSKSRTASAKKSPSELDTHMSRLTQQGSSEREEAIDQLIEAWGKHTQGVTPLDMIGEDNSELKAALQQLEVSHDLIRILLGSLPATLDDEGMFSAVAAALQNEIKRAATLQSRKPLAAARASAEQSDAGDEDSNGASQFSQPLQLRVLRISRLGTHDSQQKEYESMNDDRMRDERGRFTDDDDDRRGGSRRSSSSRNRDDDDRRYSSRRDDDDRRSYSSRRDDDEDGRGWYGDSRGHSEAAREGWQTRRGESRYEDDENRSRRRSRSDDDDDDRRGSRGHGGWFGDSEGHSRAARGQSMSSGSRSSGRYEDDDDDRRSRSRSSHYDDDDRRMSGRDRGQGGWFGDSEGHSEASRRGWEHRRDDDDDDRRSRRR